MNKKCLDGVDFRLLLLLNYILYIGMLFVPYEGAPKAQTKINMTSINDLNILHT